MQTKPEVFDIPLHDIKPLIDIPEYSLYYLIALSSLALLLIFGILYLIIHWWRKRNRFTLRAEHLKLIKSIDYSDAKKEAYEITQYAMTFKDDSERHQRAYENLVENLQQYKYKKHVDKFNDETMHLIENYVGLIDV